jgi:hypothetical protein
MVSMPQSDNTYDAVALIKQVYGTITPPLDFLKINPVTGFITLKDPNPSLKEFPAVSTLKDQISKLTSAIGAITNAKNGINRDSYAAYPLEQSDIQKKINHVKNEMKKDGHHTNYAAHAYVLNCLLHVRALLNERMFKATYLQTIAAAQKAGVAPFY